MKIDKMQISDLSTVYELEKKSFSDAWSEEMLKDCLNSERYFIITAKDEKGAIIGYSGLVSSGDFADVTRIAVFPEFQAKGVGSLLFKELLNECKRRRIATLFLEVRADNSPAIALYEKFRGERFGIRKNYYGGGIDALLYRFTEGEKPLGI